jgi:hypothetical protein
VLALVAGNGKASERIAGAASAQPDGTDNFPMVFASPRPAETGEPRFVITAKVESPPSR